MCKPANGQDRIELCIFRIKVAFSRYDFLQKSLEMTAFKTKFYIKLRLKVKKLRKQRWIYIQYILVSITRDKVW